MTETLAACLRQKHTVWTGQDTSSILLHFVAVRRRQAESVMIIICPANAEIPLGLLSVANLNVKCQHVAALYSKLDHPVVHCQEIQP